MRIETAEAWYRVVPLDDGVTGWLAPLRDVERLTLATSQGEVFVEVRMLNREKESYPEAALP